MNILHDQTWSLSKLKMLEQCPLHFYLKYIVKQPAEGAADTTERDLGLTMHYLLELMQSGYTIREAYLEAEEKYREIVGDNWNRVEGMMPSVFKFNRLMHDRDDATPFDYAVPEIKLAINRDFEPVDFFDKDAYFRGVIDYSARIGRNSLVLDYKKGGMGFLTKYHSPQLSSYLVLDYYCNGKYEKGESWIYYIERAELSKGPEILGANIEKYTRPWLVNKIDTAIRVVETEGMFAHARGNYCKYCDYADTCKNGKRGTCGGLIKFAEESKEIL